jgi:hypothetical protein
MIRDLTKTRRDGKIILESMSIDQIAALGWSPDKVVQVTWSNDEQTVDVRAPCGVLAKTLPDRTGVAWLEAADEADTRSNLSVLNADGSVRFVLPNAQVINGSKEAGVYCWYEPARSSPATNFGVVFRIDRSQALFQVDVDVYSGTTAGVYELR